MQKRAKRGQTAVLFALACPVIVGMVSLGVDSMMTYYNWEELQTAADSAALAGAVALPGDPATALSDARQYAESNGVQQTEIASTTVASDDSYITVSLQRDVPTFFARVLGIDDQWVKVTAVAGPQNNSNGTTGLIPLGLSCDSGIGAGDCAYSSGWYSLKSSKVGPGNWDPVELGGTPGASAYKNYLEYGFIGDLSTTVPTEPGNVVGPTAQAVNYRLNRGTTEDASSTYTNPANYDPRLVVVPLIKFNDANGKQPVTIVGYAKAWIGSLSDNNSTVNIYFEGFINTVPSTLSEQNFGLDHPVLLK